LFDAIRAFRFAPSVAQLALECDGFRSTSLNAIELPRSSAADSGRSRGAPALGPIRATTINRAVCFARILHEFIEDATRRCSTLLDSPQRIANDRRFTTGGRHDALLAFC